MTSIFHVEFIQSPKDRTRWCFKMYSNLTHTCTAWFLYQILKLAVKATEAKLCDLYHIYTYIHKYLTSYVKLFWNRIFPHRFQFSTTAHSDFTHYVLFKSCKMSSSGLLPETDDVHLRKIYSHEAFFWAMQSIDVEINTVSQAYSMHTPLHSASCVHHKKFSNI